MKALRMSMAGLALLLCAGPAFARQPATDATTPLHQLRPDYPVPYGVPRPEEVARLLQLIHAYLEETTPAGFINSLSYIA